MIISNRMKKRTVRNLARFGIGIGIIGTAIFVYLIVSVLL